MMPSPTPSRKDSSTQKEAMSDRSTSHASDSTNSNLSQDDSAPRRSEIEASMRKFLPSNDDDDEVDYLDSLSGGKNSTSKSSNQKKSSKDPNRISTRKKSAASSKKLKDDDGISSKSTSKRRSSAATSTRGRKKDALSTTSEHNSNHSEEKTKRKGSRSASGAAPSVDNNNKNNNNEARTSDEVYGEYTLNDDDGKTPGAPNPAKSMRKSAKALFDRAVRAASPGALRRQRSKSPGVAKIRKDLTNSPTGSTTMRKQQRSKSPGRLKKKVVDRDSSDNSSAGAAGKSIKSTKKRSESPGRLKKRSQSPGQLRKSTRAQRRATRENGDDDDNDGTLGAMLDRKNAEAKPKKRESRSVASAPMRRKPERTKSSDGVLSTRIRSEEGGGRPRPPQKSKSVDAACMNSNNNRSEMPSKSRRSPMKSQDEGQEQEAPLTEDKSYSDMQDELSRHKHRRNKSVDSATALVKDNDDEKSVVRRPESMMLRRENGRRGSKQNSLANLVQYKEEEIHSTSYFASNHVLINRERMKRGLRPLSRNIAMDDLARKSAEAMAESNGDNPLRTTYVGNVLRGETIRSIHRSTMMQKKGRERANLLNPFFQDFGVGTCKGDDGMLFMCQLFSERLELALTDTVSDQNEQQQVSS